MRTAALLFSALLSIALAACAPGRTGEAAPGATAETSAKAGPDKSRAAGIPATAAAAADTAIFAGGCFWCMEGPFDQLEGVLSTTSGFTGGQTVDPSYDEVSSGGTGHTEAIRVVFDPKKISYDRLLEVFWRNIDPTQADGQFCDRGTQYRSGIFYLDETQRQKAEASKKALATKGLPGPVVTEVTAAGTFYPAEEYHQDFYKKDPIRYKSYRFGCGRDRRLEQLWGSSH